MDVKKYCQPTKAQSQVISTLTEPELPEPKCDLKPDFSN